MYLPEQCSEERLNYLPFYCDGSQLLKRSIKYTKWEELPSRQPSAFNTYLFHRKSEESLKHLSQTCNFGSLVTFPFSEGEHLGVVETTRFTNPQTWV